jgi:hypothetical protein
MTRFVAIVHMTAPNANDAYGVIEDALADAIDSAQEDPGQYDFDWEIGKIEVWGARAFQTITRGPQ